MSAAVRHEPIYIDGQWYCAYRTPGLRAHYTAVCECFDEASARSVAQQMNAQQRVVATQLAEERRLSGFRARPQHT